MAVSKELYSPKLVADLVKKTKGRSSLAVLAPQIPVAFTGNKEFIFSLDSDIDVVAENGKKSHGGISMEPIAIVPIKVEYGARVSDEFMTASDEEKVNVLEAFNDGFAKKLASGLDKMAMHGINPRTGTASDVIGNNCFDKKVTQVVTYDGSAPDTNIEAAIAQVEGSDGDVTGIAISPTMRSALAGMTKASGEKLYQEFAFGGKPATLGAQALEVNKTVSVGGVDEAIVGDFAGMFKWGYGKEIVFSVIEYGDPDNTGKDLKGYGQVYLRAEAHIGWAIFDAGSFSRVKN